MNGNEALSKVIATHNLTKKDGLFITYGGDLGVTIKEDDSGKIHKFIDMQEARDFIVREIEILRGTLITCEDPVFAEGVRGCIDGLCCAMFWMEILCYQNKERVEEVFNDIYGNNGSRI
jgi:hypothetical protein